MEKYDLNKDGFFSKDEISPAQEEAIKKVTSDANRKLAPYTSITIVVTGIIFFLFARKKRAKAN
ncbi:MAG: hypothetical protein ACWIPJ_10725 [Polaribacter sp.]